MFSGEPRIIAHVLDIPCHQLWDASIRANKLLVNQNSLIGLRFEITQNQGESCRGGPPAPLFVEFLQDFFLGCAQIVFDALLVNCDQAKWRTQVCRCFISTDNGLGRLGRWVPAIDAQDKDQILPVIWTYAFRSSQRWCCSRCLVVIISVVTLAEIRFGIEVLPDLTRRSERRASLQGVPNVRAKGSNHPTMNGDVRHLIPRSEETHRPRVQTSDAELQTIASFAHLRH